MFLHGVDSPPFGLLEKPMISEHICNQELFHCRYRYHFSKKYTKNTRPSPYRCFYYDRNLGAINCTLRSGVALNRVVRFPCTAWLAEQGKVPVFVVRHFDRQRCASKHSLTGYPQMWDSFIASYEKINIAGNDNDGPFSYN